MHDLVSRVCVGAANCPAGTLSYAVNMSCVSFCPGPAHYALGSACVTNCSAHASLKYADDLTRRCVSSCPSGTYRDPLSFRCVTVCPTAPVQYFVSGGDCLTGCPEGSYADPQ